MKHIQGGYRTIRVFVGSIGPDLFTAISRPPPRPAPRRTAKDPLHRQRTRESETRRDLRGSKTRPSSQTTYQPLIAFPFTHLHSNPPDPFIVHLSFQLLLPNASGRHHNIVVHPRTSSLCPCLPVLLPACTATPSSTAPNRLGPRPHGAKRSILHVCTAIERLNVVPQRHGLPGRRLLGAAVPFSWPPAASTTSSRRRGHADAAHGT